MEIKTRNIFITSLTKLIILTLFMSLSCKKNDNYVRGTIIDAGDPTTDGCGWLIEIDNQRYYPINLAEKFKTPAQNIYLSYDKLEEFTTCGFPSSTSPRLQNIKIINIKHR